MKRYLVSMVLLALLIVPILQAGCMKCEITQTYWDGTAWSDPAASCLPAQYDANGDPVYHNCYVHNDTFGRIGVVGCTMTSPCLQKNVSADIPRLTQTLIAVLGVDSAAKFFSDSEQKVAKIANAETKLTRLGQLYSLRLHQAMPDLKADETFVPASRSTSSSGAVLTAEPAR